MAYRRRGKGALGGEEWEGEKEAEEEAKCVHA
jgi:hypothetical protein